MKLKETFDMNIDLLFFPIIYLKKVINLFFELCFKYIKRL